MKIRQQLLSASEIWDLDPVLTSLAPITALINPIPTSIDSTHVFVLKMEREGFTYGAPALNDLDYFGAPGMQSANAQAQSAVASRNVTTPENSFSHILSQTGVRSSSYSYPTQGQVAHNIVQSLIALPPSSFSPEQRFHVTLLTYAPRSGWLELAHDAMARVSFMILTGSIPSTLTLTSDQALDIIQTSTQWNQRVRDNPSWIPAEVRGLIIDPFTPPFSTSLEDRVFRKLLCDQVSHVPSTFFTHVRASIKRLLTPAWFQRDTTRLYPQHLIPGYTPEASTHTEWIRIRLVWDSRWGFNLWHIFVNESSEFSVWWFADRAVREVVLHALQLRESVGSFSVMVPPEYEHISEVPCTVQTVSFVLTALAVELEGIAGYTSCETITEYVARFGVLQGDILSFLTSIDERTNAHLDQQQSDAAYRGLQSFLQLKHTEDMFPMAGAAHTTTIVIA